MALSLNEREPSMTDLVFVFVTGGFFGLSILYVFACERL
jgi:hypothetical protein